MFKTVMFIIYSAAIPIVPLIGAEYYKQRNNRLKKLCCLGLFAVQSLISLGCIVSYLS